MMVETDALVKKCICKTCYSAERKQYPSYNRRKVVMPDAAGKEGA